MKKKTKRIIVISCVVAVLVITEMAVLGNMYGIGPMSGLREKRFARLPGNAAQYHPENIESKPDSPLSGKRVLFLGSSVTYGASSLGCSMADYLAAVDGCIVTKEAASGTTLADIGESSYVSRLKRHGAAESYDAIVIQLSTNDATKKLPLGEMTDARDTESFDSKTVIGAIETILQYAEETWNCPILFYTGTRYESVEYAAMVEALAALQNKWGFEIIDLWNNEEMNAVSAEDYALYMEDKIHPTQAGYLNWWLPAFENTLIETLTEQS